MKIRIPDVITVLDAEKNVICDERICVSTNMDNKNEGLSAYVSSTLPIGFVVFAWKLTDAEKLADNLKVFGDAWERGYGDLEWREVDSTRMMPWFFMVSSGSDSVREYTGRKTSCFGVKVRPSAFCSWRCSKDEITLYMDIRSGNDPVMLGERRLHLADIIFKEYTDISAFESGESFCREMCSDPISFDGQVYGFNDWYYAYGSNSAEGILSDAEKLSELTKENQAPAYMVIDDGWQPNSCDGPWREGNEKFPDMEKLAGDISNMGLIPGIWIRPLKQTTPDTEVKDEWRQTGDESLLDPSNPEVIDYISRQIECIVSWGYKLIKYDFVTRDIFGVYGFQRTEFMDCKNVHFKNNTLTTAEIILNLYSAIRKAVGDAVLIGCNTVGHLCAGLVEIDRTGDDTSGKEWERTRKMGINTLAFRMMQHKAFYLADADCVGLTQEIDWELNSRWLKILSVSGTPLFISWDRSFNSNEIENAVKTALARGSHGEDRLVPLDWMEKLTPERWLLNGEEISFKWE